MKFKYYIAISNNIFKYHMEITKIGYDELITCAMKYDSKPIQRICKYNNRISNITRFNIDGSKISLVYRLEVQ